MATIASLLVVMGMDTKALTAGAVKAESSLAGLGVSAKTLGAVVPAAAAVAAAAVVKFGADAVQAASDLHESINKVEVVFGSSAKEIEDWASTTSTSIGISEQAALEAAGTFGNLFDAMGLTQSAGTEMSTTLVDLAADLASFNNADPSDVLAAMQSGLTGQIRPLRQYGIEISDAAIQQEALAEGITKSTSQMTMAEKVQLRYALILKQTGNAQGDFERTSDGLANQQRILAAQWADLQAQIGTLLLPAVLSLVSAFNDLATVLLFLTGADIGWDEFKAAGASFAEWSLGIGDLVTKAATGIPIIGDLIKAAQAAGVALEASGAGAQLTGDQLNILAMNINGQSSAYESLRKHWKGVADDFLGFIDLSKKKIPEIERAMNKIPKAFRDTGEALQEEIPSIIGTVTRYKDAFDLSPKELQAITHHWAEIAKTIAHDLRVLGDSDLKPAMREAIAALPPEMRHAWVEGNASQRHSIEQNISDTYKVSDQMPALARQALQGGRGVGSNMADGIIAGIKAGAPFIMSAAKGAVEAAVAAANRAAGSHSPSKVMAELGRNLMLGLANGISDAEEAALKAAQKAIEATIKDIEKRIETVSSALDKIKSKASAFRDTISGGIGGFGDIGGAFEAAQGGEVPLGISQILQQQVSGAQELADVLRELKKQGASKGLLSEVAETGAAFGRVILQSGVGEANQAIQDIADLSKQTGKALSEAFFGKSIDKISAKLDVLHQDLKTEKQQDNVVINIQGWVGNDQDIAKRVRDELVKLGKRNVTSGI